LFHLQAQEYNVIQDRRVSVYGSLSNPPGCKGRDGSDPRAMILPGELTAILPASTIAGDQQGICFLSAILPISQSTEPLCAQIAHAILASLPGAARLTSKLLWGSIIECENDLGKIPHAKGEENCIGLLLCASSVF
jgi:hypothetical protein